MKFQKGDTAIYIGNAMNFSLTPPYNIIKKLNGRKCEIRNIEGGSITSTVYYSVFFPDPDLRTMLVVYPHNLISEEDLEEEKRKKERLSLIHKDIDPYGEEIWEMWRSDMPDDVVIKQITPSDIWENWSKRIDFLKKKLIGKCASFFILDDKNKQKGRVGHLWIDDIYMKKDLESVNRVHVVGANRVHIVGHGFFSDSSNNIDVILNLHEIIEYEDKIKRIVSKEDPYGEEDWEINESKKELYLGDKVKFANNIDSIYGNRIGVITDFRLNRTQYKVDFEGYTSGNWYYREQLIKVKETRNKKLRDLKLKYKDIDPYGEEDWENESVEFKEYYKFLKDYVISYENKEECFTIAHNLEKFGFTVCDYNDNEIDEWCCFSRGNRYDFSMACRKWNDIKSSKEQAMKYDRNKKHIDCNEFCNLINISSKWKKIQNIELDPYGEEDWGWEMREIKNYKNFSNGK